MIFRGLATILDVAAGVSHILWCHLLKRHRWRFDGWYWYGIKVDRLEVPKHLRKRLIMVDVCERCGGGRISEPCQLYQGQKEHSHG